MGSRLEAAPFETLAAPAWLFAMLETLAVGAALFDANGGLCHANRSYREAMAHEHDGGLPPMRQAFSLDGLALEEPSYPCIQLVGTVAIDPRAAPAATGDLDAYGDVAVIEADAADGRLTHASPAAARLLALPSGANDPRPADRPRELIHQDDQPLVALQRIGAGGGRFSTFQYRLVDEQGIVTRHVRETSFPIPSRHPAAKRIGGLLEDVSPEIMIYLVQPAEGRDRELVAGLCDYPSRITTFATQEDLLQVAGVLNPGCVILDLRRMSLARADLLRILELRPADFQVILVGEERTSAHDIIGALKAGAADYLLEPGARAELPAAVHRTSQRLLAAPLAQGGEQTGARDRLEALSRREYEVLMGLVNSGTNKSIARALSISPRTVETHRAKLMQRLHCRSLTELLQLAHDLGLRQAHWS